jgi:predicted ATP-binding protein involved in virulence
MEGPGNDYFREGIVMRIDRLEVRNFRKFSTFDLSLHRQFTLLIGGNGAGKTSLLDALAVALGVWLVEPPDSTLYNSRRGISPSEIRLEGTQTGDRIQFREAQGGVSVKATGQIEDRENLVWERKIRPGRKKASNTGARVALEIVAAAFHRASAEERVLLPVIAYYGAGRSWLPHRERSKSRSAVNGQARRWAAFYDCLNERIRLADLGDWFHREALAAVNRAGRFRAGYEVVRAAVLRCVPGADGMWFDGDRGEIVLSINCEAQPFSNLSAGQRMMLALVADIAIKAVTQNNFLVPDDRAAPVCGDIPEVLARTPGVVLIDELDVHLHPSWQRRVATDLKSTFPRIQFVCASHSPQVIGEVAPDEIRQLDQPAGGRAPDQSYGLDSNSILEDVMGAQSRTHQGVAAIEAVEATLEEGDLETARQNLEILKQLQHGTTRDTVRLEATINNLEVLSDENH